MMSTTRILTTATLLCLLPLQNAVAAAYKWVDNKGETHYSQTPPAATQVQVIRAPSNSSAAPSTPGVQTGTNSPSESADGAASPSASAKAEDAAIRTKNCSGARSNLDILNNAGDVTVKDANGLLHTLTPEERKIRIDAAEKSISEFCKD